MTNDDETETRQRQQPCLARGCWCLLQVIIFVLFVPVCVAVGILDSYFLDIYTIILVIIGYIFTIILVIIGFRRVHNYRLQQRRQYSTLYRMSMEDGFQDTVRTTAAAIQSSYVGDPTGKLLESGVYQVNVRDVRVLDTKTNNRLYGGLENPSTLTIDVTPHTTEEGGGGYSVQGSRKVTSSKQLYVISRGYISPGGGAYWVEKGSHQNILVRGAFQGEQFTGEWLSSNGNRGSYSDFCRVPAVQVLSVVQADAAEVVAMETSTATPNEDNSEEESTAVEMTMLV